MLRSGSPSDIRKMFARMNVERTRIITDLTALSYFMRGGLQYADAFDLTPVERSSIREFIESHLERESGKPAPQY